MNRDLTVTKRDRSKEALNLDKIHRVIEWAAEGLNNVSVSRFEYQQHILHYERLKSCFSFQDMLQYLTELGLKERLSSRWLVVIKTLNDYLANLRRKTTPVDNSITYKKLLQRRLQCRSPPPNKMITQYH